MAINNEALQQQLINDLILESTEGLDRFDQELMGLEKGTGGADTLNIVFRVIHTIKGTAGCIGLGKIENVAHVGESLLSLLRDGKLTVTPPMISALLEYSDALKEMMRCLEQTGQQGEQDYAPLLAKLQQLQTGEPPAVVDAPVNQGWGLFEDEPVEAAQVAPEPVPAPVVASAPSPAAPERPEPPIAPPVSAPAQPTATQVEASATRSGTSVSDSAIRVDVGHLDKLMNLVGELVLARNQILQYTGESTEPTLANASQRLNIITTELQESVMKTRMQPIGNVWGKYPRIVRDVARELGKKIQLLMEGEQTELDRTIIEAIKDPLTHIIRNSIDHGIEKPEVRRKAGKPEEGLLILRAFHEGGQVNIEIMDDGGGINVQRVKQKALERGLIAADHASRMNDREVFNLIFLPGFSTAEKVTNVSGRGVGMDVVKTNIEKIGGSVDILSELGQGTTLKIKIPLTLAIIPALIVTSAGDRFAIPQVSLLELVRLGAGQAHKQIEYIQGTPFYRLRGQLLPLVFLKQSLASPDPHSAGACGSPDGRHSGDTGEVFVQARIAHRAWLEKLNRVLNGTLQMTADEAGSHRHCQLGKWLYSEGLRKYDDLPEVLALEKAHERFHNLVREIVAHKLANQLDKSRQGLEDLTRASDQVIEHLAQAEKSILSSQAANIVVLQADGRQFGLIVDQINDTEEIVVKPLGKQLKGISCFAGATIMGDGQVALILDVLGLAQHARVVTEVRDRALVETGKGQERFEDKQTLLVFEVGESARLAIPLSMVARLEEFPRMLVERSGDQEVIQYRGQILPLIQVTQHLPLAGSGASEADPMQVVVYSERGRSVGLVVGRIHDIVQEALTVKRDTRRPGILGSAVIQEKVTDLLDVEGIIRSADPSFYEEPVHA